MKMWSVLVSDDVSMISLFRNLMTHTFPLLWGHFCLSIFMNERVWRWSTYFFPRNIDLDSSSVSFVRQDNHRGLSDPLCSCVIAMTILNIYFWLFKCRNMLSTSYWAICCVGLILDYSYSSVCWLVAGRNHNIFGMISRLWCVWVSSENDWCQCIVHLNQMKKAIIFGLDDSKLSGVMFCILLCEAMRRLCDESKGSTR